jgi:hypothetical protein
MSNTISQKRILAFDIGIKNLAWCCADVGADKVRVKGWSNENLITGGTAETDSAQGKCLQCSHKAAFWHIPTEKGYCSRHCPPLTPALRDLSGNLIRGKMPQMGVLKEIAQRSGADKKDVKTKAAAIEFLEKRYCFPKAPAPKVKKVELEDLHDGIRAVCQRNKELFGSCSEILLENQPVLKNPVMKSVQMMLFATLRDVLQPNPPKVRLVHAGRKTEGATKGDEGYSERKGASEEMVKKGLSVGGKILMECHSQAWFLEQTKKSDLADCLVMCADAGSVSLRFKKEIADDGALR